MAPQIEPQFARARAARGAPPSPEAVKAREDLRKWRLETPLDHFRARRKKFDAAGITIYAYNYSLNDELHRRRDRSRLRDGEGARRRDHHGLDDARRGEADRAVRREAPDGRRRCTATRTSSDPNEFATPESFAAAMKMSKYFKVNLDIGHFTAANYDAVAYIREHHADITNLHLKDRKKNQGDNVPWGAGRHADSRSAAAAEAGAWPIRAVHRIRVSRHRHAGRRSEEVLSPTRKQALA